MTNIDDLGVIFPRGFKAGGINCGIKKKKRDLGIIFSEADGVCSGVFTTNLVKAAPVLVSKEHIIDGDIKAIVVNSGNANACTGKQGMADCRQMGKMTAEKLGIRADQVIVSSTGVIGVNLDMEKIEKGIEECSEVISREDVNGLNFSKSIMTTDTFHKSFTDSLVYEGKEIRVGGTCKGSGMIHPNMATTLAFMTTDVAITKELLDEILLEGINKSFNNITVDGDTSTNDMFIILANGASSINVIDNKEESIYEEFKEVVINMMIKMAKSIVKDGEGATKFIEVRVEGTRSDQDALQIGKSIASSSLVKTAAFGEDANWGRILCAAGYAGIDFDPSDTNIYIGSKEGELLVYELGNGLNFDEDLAKKILKEKDIYYLIEFSIGKGSSVVYTCDLSYDYVKINGSYRS